VALPRSAAAAHAALGVGRLALSDVVDALPTSGTPSLWRTRYAGLAGLADDANAREVLAALPVPLADGRVVRGARGVLLPSDDRLPVSALATLSPYGLRVVHPDAAHPLLARLGATTATARAVLQESAVRLAVEQSPDADEPEDVADAVLALVRAALQEAAPVPGAWADGELHWLADLALTDAEDEVTPAGALVLPGSTAAAVLEPREVGVVDSDLVRVWGPDVLRAVGVLDGLAVVRADEVDLDDLPEHLGGLADVDEWADETGSGTVAELVGVRDLDVVRSQCWPKVLRHLASEPVLRRALVERVRVAGSDGSRSVPSYTAWWLRRQLGTVGLIDPAVGTGLGGLLDRAPQWVADLDGDVRRALGLVGDLDSADVSLAAVVLARLADPDRDVDAATCLRAWALLGECAADLDAPVSESTRVLDGAGSRVVASSDAVVADDPKWLQRSDLGGLVVVTPALAPALADLLDVALASEVADGRVRDDGVAADVPTEVTTLLPQAPRQWCEHDRLLVDDVEVQWWVDAGGVHAATTDGLARGLAFAAGRWPARHALARLLAEPGDVVRLVVEDAAG
ncbi:MAG: hypothetical protein ABIV05_03220, partial [Actinomycetota bacterium]